MRQKQQWKTGLLLPLFISIFFLCAFTCLRTDSETEYANVVSYPTPVDVTSSGAAWLCSFRTSGNTSNNSVPILTEKSVYLVNENVLYEINYSGKITNQLTLCRKMNSVCYMLLEENKLFIPLADGVVECIDIGSMTSLWQSESFGGQSLSTLFFHDGFLYGGATRVTAGGTTGTFYCLRASDGKTQWSYENREQPGGYYWSGAIVLNDVLLFTGDNGILVSHSLKDEEVFDLYTLTESAQIRAGFTYDKQTGFLYTVSTDGILYQISMDGKKVVSVSSAPLIPSAASVRCTCTPTIFNGRIYTGCIADKKGQVSVTDAASLTPIYQVTAAPNMEIKSSPLVSTRNLSDGTVYVYVTGNAFPGGIYYFTDGPTSVSSTLQTLFTPASKYQQFCMSGITAGEDGTLYYSNDSGTLFAIREGVCHEPVPETVPAISTTHPTPQPEKTSTAVKPPKKIKTKKGKGKIKISWKKQTKGSQTVIQYKYRTGRWKKKLIQKKSCIFLSKKRRLYFRLQSRIKKNKTWHYSTFTKTFFVK